MAFKHFVALGASLSAVSGLAIEARTDKCRKQDSRTIDFECSAASILGNLTSILNRVNTKADFDFGAFVFVDSKSALLAPAVTPQSPTNVAAVGIGGKNIDLLKLGLLPSTQPSTKITPAVKAKYFDLNSGYFACVLNSETSAASTTQACSISIEGIDYQGDAVSSEDVDYAPGALVKDTMTFKKFEGFEKMKEVSVTLGGAGVAPAAVVAMQIDNLDVTPYCC